MIPWSKLHLEDYAHIEIFKICVFTLPMRARLSSLMLSGIVGLLIAWMMVHHFHDGWVTLVTALSLALPLGEPPRGFCSDPAAEPPIRIWISLSSCDRSGDEF